MTTWACRKNNGRTWEPWIMSSRGIWFGCGCPSKSIDHQNHQYPFIKMGVWGLNSLLSCKPNYIKLAKNLPLNPMNIPTMNSLQISHVCIWQTILTPRSLALASCPWSLRSHGSRQVCFGWGWEARRHHLWIVIICRVTPTHYCVYIYMEIYCVYIYRERFVMIVTFWG